MKPWSNRYIRGILFYIACGLSSRYIRAVLFCIASGLVMSIAHAAMVGDFVINSRSSIAVGMATFVVTTIAVYIGRWVDSPPRKSTPRRWRKRANS